MAVREASSKSAHQPGFFRRILELILLLLTSLAALFYFKSAEEAQVEKRRLEEELRRVKSARDDSAGGRCAVCMGNPLEVALAPCGHVCLCRECADKVDTCPICREDIQDRTGVFVAT